MRRLTIRKKLLAGLLLVLGISAVLTTNTLLGLYSYRSSIRAFESKTRELPAGSELSQSAAQLDHPGTTGQTLLADEVGIDFASRLRLVDEAMDDYRVRLRKTLDRGGDPDAGKAELELLAGMQEQLDELRKLPPYPYWADDEQWLWDLSMGGERLANRRLFRARVATLRSLATALPVRTYRDMKSLSADLYASFQRNLWIAWSTGVLVLVMLGYLARLSYRWIFRPIQQLHRSVQMVGEGRLSHRVELHTGDEMEELADAFNQMTERLQAICLNLEEQVEVRSQQLVRSEQLASVGFLAAGVAHEINNPLASISFGSETLERRLRALLPPGAGGADDVWRCLSVIQSEAFRCKDITEKLLDFSRLRDHQREPCSLANIVADVIDVVQHMGRYREKQIVLSGSSDVVAEVNPQEIKQVVLNLVVNALDSMDANGTLEIDVRNEGDQAVLVFTDDGCGMTPDVLHNIFQPFFTRSRTGKGTGLGLSITHRIVTEHRGQIEAHSAGSGKGSRFTVSLPLTTVPACATAPYEEYAA